MRYCSPLFRIAIRNPTLEAVYPIFELLGELSPHLKLVQFNEDGYLELDGCENLVDLSGDVEKFPVNLEVKDIEAERISLPSAIIPLRGEKPSRKA